jgi:hypothetical protein
MPITPFLKDSNFSPDLMRVVKVAFAMTRAALQHPAEDHPAVIMAAKRIVEFAKGGECNPDRLCEQALSEIGDSKFQQQAHFDFQRGSGFSLLGSPVHKSTTNRR